MTTDLLSVETKQSDRPVKSLPKFSYELFTVHTFRSAVPRSVSKMGRLWPDQRPIKQIQTHTQGLPDTSGVDACRAYDVENPTKLRIKAYRRSSGCVKGSTEESTGVRLLKVLLSRRKDGGMSARSDMSKSSLFSRLLFHHSTYVSRVGRLYVC